MLAEIQRKYSVKDVTFLMIASNQGNGEIVDRELEEGQQPFVEIRDYLAREKLPHRVLIDRRSSVARMFQAKTTPDVFVFDAEGRLVYRGLIDDDPRDNKPDERTDFLRDALARRMAAFVERVVNRR